MAKANSNTKAKSRTKTKSAGRGRNSPAMQQFFRAKQDYPNALLFFRLGDFYELFFEDAVLASQLLDLTLTSRGADEHGIPIPMAGVPHHAAGGYVARLIERGQSVALCEQMADPSQVKGIVPREVVRVVTPGLVLDSEALDARSHNYLASIAETDGRLGLAVLELSTAELRATEVATRADLVAELVRLAPREVLLEDKAHAQELQPSLPNASLRSEPVDTGVLDDAAELQAVLQDAVNREEHRLGAAGLAAARTALAYAQRTQPRAALPVHRIAPYDTAQQLELDDAAVRNLELVTTLTGERKGSLIHLVDVTRSPMGARAMRQRLLAPLMDIATIRRRHDRVERFVEDPPLREALRDCLGSVGDLERLATRASLGLATPRDLGAMRDGLVAVRALADSLAGAVDERRAEDPLASMLPADACEDLRERLCAELVESPPVSSATGGIFIASVDPAIAELRHLSESSKDVILQVEARERERTGIATLKLRFTKVFGYYIEVTKSRLAAVPEEYVRKQTVAGGERFTTPELEALQAKILNADERLRALEQSRFERLRQEVSDSALRLKRLAQELADIDVHGAWADLAHRHNYVRPVVDDSEGLTLQEARHPIVEQHVERGTFVPNDVTLDTHGERLMMITGPNMAGKSTTMRQVALCVIMAQAGGYVPAQAACIGVVDRVHTRVGASDNVAQGDSTFMVEMRETASILHGATRRSLVILDEIGRGTSTYDGLAIAWAVAEHLHDAIQCRAMFATHYHELCELSDQRTGVANYNVAAKEYRDEVVFLRKLVPGGANRSYGIAVAKLAGVPAIVLARAKALLEDLEAHTLKATPQSPTKQVQIDMFEAPSVAQSQVERTLQGLDPDTMTPVEALVALARLKDLL